MLREHLQRKLHAIAQAGQTRQLRAAQSATAPHQRIASAGGTGGQPRDMLMFCANDYLGLAAHPALAQAMAEGAQRFGTGAGGSHLISGHTQAHQDMEDELASWYQYHLPAARVLSFCTGYMANLAVISALGDARSTVFSDALNHASLIDGCRLARATVQRYAHGDVADLARQLAACSSPIKLIVSDAVFSMDGNIAPLQALAELAQAHDAWLIVDDAHGFGVLGAQGRGTLEALQLRCDRLVLIGTLGKAAGVSGAFVASHSDVIEYLIQAARPYIFTTACPPAVACAVQASLGLIAGPEGVARRMQLQRLQAHFQIGMRSLLAARPSLNWQLLDSPTPIQGVVVGENDAAMRLSQALDAAGIRVPGIRPPTVPVGQARLRITLCATHSVADIDRLLNALEDAA